MALFNLLNSTKPDQDIQAKHKLSYQQQNDLLIDIHGNIAIKPHLELQKKTNRKNSQSFIHQKIDVESLSFLPEGYEKIMLFVYILLLPYIAGLIFLFTYISKWDYKIYLSLNSANSYIFTWCIGYEILAVLGLLMIIKSAISYNIGKLNSQTKKL